MAENERMQCEFIFFVGAHLKHSIPFTGLTGRCIHTPAHAHWVFAFIIINMQFSTLDLRLAHFISLQTRLV